MGFGNDESDLYLGLYVLVKGMEGNNHVLMRREAYRYVYTVRMYVIVAAPIRNLEKTIEKVA